MTIDLYNDDRCVYLHYLNDIVVYVGSGCKERVKHKSNRCPEHLKVWDQLDFVIIKEGLNQLEARKIEENLITLYSQTIFNKAKKTAIWHNVDYDFISNYVYYDESIPQKLRWKIDCGWNGVRFTNKKDSPAGGLPKIKRYSTIKIDKIRYMSSRVVYSIFNSISIKGDYVVDHINRDKSNISASNLRLVSHSVNCKNKNYLETNTGLHRVSEIKSRKSFVITYVVNKIRKSITFSYRKKSREIALQQAIEKRDNLISKGIINAN